VNTRQQGRWGEALALDLFLRKGYKAVAMGFRTRYGEIDVLVQNEEYIVFAEVKVRKNDKFAEAREFVDWNKQERLRKTALLWLTQNDTALQPRFDVVEIYAPFGAATAKPRINHIENAF
jgi:putative endonuclease